LNLFDYSDCITIEHASVLTSHKKNQRVQKNSNNEFYIVGPNSDPAGIPGAKNAADACARITAAKAAFFSRGDNFGAHKKEMAIWEKAVVELSGNWYAVTKTFMVATLKMADEKPGYFMTGSSTWVAAKKDISHLKILFRGEPVLINIDHTPYANRKTPPRASPWPPHLWISLSPRKGRN